MTTTPVTADAPVQQSACCGSPAPAAAVEPATSTAASPCCGTASQAETSGGCCGAAAKADAIAAGASCCG